jgi:hypothetical protein
MQTATAQNLPLKTTSYMLQQQMQLALQKIFTPLTKMKIGYGRSDFSGTRKRP